MNNRNLIKNYVEFLLRHRLAILTLVPLLVLCLGVFASRISFDTNYRIWFEESDPYLQSYDRFISEFGNDDMFVVAFEDESGVLQEKALKSIQRITERMWNVTGIIRVDSITNHQATRAIDDGISIEALFPEEGRITPDQIEIAKRYIESEPLVKGALITNNNQVAMIRGRFAPSAIDPLLPSVVYGEIMEVLSEESKLTGYKYYIAGGPITDQAFDQVAQSDVGRLIPIVLGVLALLLLLFLRSITAMLIPMGVAVLSIVATMGLTGLMGYKLNTITASVPHIILGLTVAATLHLLFTFFRQRNDAKSSAKALIAAMQKNLYPLVITSTTTAVGFYSFIFSTVVPIKRLGFMVGSASMIIVLLTITLVPVLLSYYPDVKKTEKNGVTRVNILGLVTRLSHWVVRNSKQVVMGSAMVSLIFIAFIPNVVIDSNPSKYFSKDFWFSQSIDFLETRGSGGAVYEIVVRGRDAEAVKTVAYMQDLEKLTNYLKSGAPTQYANVSSLSGVVSSINRSLHSDDSQFYKVPLTDEEIAQYLLLYTLSVPQGQSINDRLNVDYSASRVTVIRPLVGSQQSRADIDAIMAWSRQNLHHVSIEFTGRDVLYTNMGNNVSDSLIRSLLFAVVIVTLLIMIIFRSLKAALVSLIPNLLPIAFVVGFMSMSNIMLDVGTIMVVSVGLGIAVDDTIHFLSHYFRATREGKSSGAAITETLTSIIVPITVTTISLASAFLIFMMADFMPNYYFGLLIAMVLSIALIADVTLLPALLYQLDKYNLKKSLSLHSSEGRSQSVLIVQK